MSLLLRASSVELVAQADTNRRWKSGWLEVIDPAAVNDALPLAERCASRYRYMCEAIHCIAHSADEAGAVAIKEIEVIESSQVDHIDTGANAWIVHISRDKVWFEGLYEQGTGGAVTFAQYKLAVETYVRFLADPERKPIEVPFPET